MKLFFILFWPFLAQAFEFKSFVDKTEVGLNETFVLTLQFESESSLPAQVSAPELFSLKDFHFLNEFSSQRSSVQIINGKMSKTNTLLKTYRLQAKAVGFFKIPALTVQADGKTFQTQSVVIKVVKDRPSAPSQAPLSIPSFPFNIPDPFNFPHSVFDNLPNLLSGQEKASAKLKLELSKNSVYKSESLKADWFILSSSHAVRFNLLRIPDLKGFWKEKQPIQNPAIGSEVVGKTLYRKQLIDSLWLFPLKAGELELDVYSVQLSGFFSGDRIISVPAQKIKVKNLPSEGLDKTFTGAVGDFSVQYLMKKTEGAVNEPLSLKITFKGSGHPRFIDLPDIPFPSSVDTYPPVQKSQFSNKGIGTKEFEILIIPKQEGRLIIPSFSLSTFNPETNQYIVHQSPEFLISIQQGKTSDDLGESFLEESDTNTKTGLFNNSPLEISYWPSFINYKNLIWFFTGLFCFFALFLMVVFIKKNVFNREKSLKEKVNKKFLAIQDLLDKKDWQTACINIIQLGVYVLSSSQLQDSTSDWEQTLKALPPSLNEKYAKKFEQLFKKLESVSFSSQTLPPSMALKQAEELFKQAKNLINQFLSHL